MESDRCVTLPKPWSVHFSKSRNLVYYFNYETGESIWSPPIGAVIGGVVITNSDEQHGCETQQSLCNSDNARHPLSRSMSQGLRNDRESEWQTTSVSPSCSRTKRTPEISATVPKSGSSTDSGSGKVSSSITRKRKSDEHFPHKAKLKFQESEASGSSATPVGRTKDLQQKGDTTPAATRLKRLQKLLHEIQDKKSAEKASPSTSASTSPSKTIDSSLNVDRKRHSIVESSRGKRRMGDASGADASKTAQTSTDLSCLVTSTTVSSSSNSRLADSHSSVETNGPESPKPGEKLSYLDSDTEKSSEGEDDVRTSLSKRIKILRSGTHEEYGSSRSRSKDVSSSLPVPSAAWSNSHRKEHTRKESFGSEKNDNIAGNIESNIVCKTEDRPKLFPKKKLLFNEHNSINDTSNAKVPVQSRLIKAASNKGNVDSNIAIKTEEKRVLCSKKEIIFNEPASLNTTSNARVPVWSCLSLPASDKGDSENICKTEGETSQFKQLLPNKLPSERSASKTRVSVQSRLSIAASDKVPHNTAFAVEEENMDVDVASTNSQENNLFIDAAAIVSFSSVMPTTNQESTDHVKRWLHQCEPSSPVGNHDLFLAEEPTDDESDKAMEWDDIEDDLSKVVSFLPTKCAKAYEWFIVVDTNILLHNLGIVEELRDTPFPRLGLPVLVIPWLVLQELDGLKAQRSQFKAKDPALCSKARWAVQFLNNNLKKGHPRVRGQTARESEFEHYKREGADDGILQCCLQLKEKGNFAVILTNDKNLTNKAIVSGISSFSNDEIVVKLHEMDSQLQSPKSQNHTRETAPSGWRSLTSDQTDLEKTKVDLVFCHMKQLLKDIFTEVLISGMKKMYGRNWQPRTIRKPPWKLSDVVYCIVKHWDVMREHEFQQKTWRTRDDKLKSCAKDVKKYMANLQTFLKNSSKKCFNYATSDLKDIINSSIDVCIGMTAEPFKEKVIETINKLEVLLEVCKEKSKETVMNLISDIQLSPSDVAANCPAVKSEKAQLKYVRDKFYEVWASMANVIGSLCDKLDIKHSIEYSVKYEFENAELICSKTSHIWPHLKALNKSFQTLEVIPLEDLSENHQVITDIYFNMKNIYFDCEQDVDDTLTPQLVYRYLTHPNGWKKILHIKEEFERFEEYLMTGIVIVSEKYPDFVVLNPATNVPAGNSARNNFY